MYRWTVLVAAVILLFAVGCAGGGNPVAPTTDGNLTASSNTGVNSNNVLWGYYDIHFDLQNQNVEVVVNRDVMFTANVVTFLNPNPAGLGFGNIVVTPDGDVMNVGLDVTISHPLNLVEYDGYDVKGIFIANGNTSLDYNSDLEHAAKGVDQILNGADGYTRWWNPAEFAGPGPEVLTYTPGKFGTPGYTGTATLNPYMYFADDIDATETAFDFFTGGGTPMFTHGESWTRHYDIDFPIPEPNVVYGYAIAASWAGETEEFHPAYALEAGAISVGVTPDIYWVDGSDMGGDLILDMDVPLFGGAPSTIWVESSVLSAPAMFPAVPMGGTDVYSSYHTEVTADNITGTEDAEFWVILEYDGDYTNEFGVPNNADTDALAAFFRYDLYISPEAYNKAPIIDSGVDGPAYPVATATESYSVTATDPDLDTLIYTWTVTDVVSGLPVAGYDAVPGDGLGGLDIDFAALALPLKTELYIDCDVSDGIAPPVSATQLMVTVFPYADWYVSNNADFSALPESGTMDEPFHSLSSAMASAYLLNDVFLVDFGTYTEQLFMSYGTGCELYGFDWYTEDTVGNGRPIIEYGTAYPVYFNYTNNMYVHGFTIQYAAGASTNYLVRNYRSNDTTFENCLFTGQTTYQFPYAVYSYYGNNFTFVNNKLADFGTNNGSSYQFPYGIYVYRGSGSHEIARNEITNFQPQSTTSYCYPYIMYAYYVPNNSKINNNLIHHIAPTVGSSQSLYVYGMYVRYPYPTLEVGHNTMDQLSIANSNYQYSTLYNMYIYDSGSTYTSDIHSNIITSPDKNNSNQRLYGVYAYDGSDYCNAWDFPVDFNTWRYYNSPEGPNSIEADPLYVEADTEPYDYTLGTGSPCIGTGRSSTDMGAYGGLLAGQTVGLITPE